MIGSNSFEAVRYIISKFDEISKVSLIEFKEPLPLQERVPEILGSNIFSKGMELREATQLPFWDCLLKNITGHDEGDLHVLKQALFHNQNDTIEHEFPRSEILRIQPESYLKNPKGSSLAISSKVTLRNGATGHIPMLDFHTPVNKGAEGIIASAMKALGLESFFVCNSGKSYHAYGLKILCQDELISFLNSALLLHPIVDTRYVAHQLRDRYCKLRIVPTSLKPFQPKTVLHVEGQESRS